jgi:hypothetical protein
VPILCSHAALFSVPGLSRHSHGLPMVSARPIGSAIWRRMRLTLHRCQHGMRWP